MYETISVETTKMCIYQSKDLEGRLEHVDIE